MTFTLNEWEHRIIPGAVLSAEQRRIAAALRKHRQLKLTELRGDRLQIQAFSYVGRIRLGPLTIVIRPKITGVKLLHLLRYAYGFHRLKLFAMTEHAAAETGIDELLILQLIAEAQELLERGLMRAYVPANVRLASPRGRIDIARIARDGGTMTATLPCRDHPRTEDTLHNRVLLAGLKIAASMARMIDLRREARRAAARLELTVSALRLDSRTLLRAEESLTRMTDVYAPALTLIRLLYDSRGVEFRGTSTPPLPGFLFDMNAFFQALVSRLLHDHLPDYEVRDECSLKGMLSYDPMCKPAGASPLKPPRPDFVIVRNHMRIAILDAKYRDLWHQRLPRHMLYQLMAYALSHSDLKASRIIYPTTHPFAHQVHIQVADPVSGDSLGTICLQPLSLSLLAELLDDRKKESTLKLEALVSDLAFTMLTKAD